MPIGKELLTLLVSGAAITTPPVPAPAAPWWGKAIRFGLAVGFPVAGRILFDLRVNGRENFTGSPGTLIVANHKTDFDIVLLGPVIFWSKRGRGPGGRIAFVAAERMFLPGYLSDYILHGPRWLQRLVYPANLSAVLKAIRAYPIGYLQTRKLKAHLRAVLEAEGDIPIQEALALPVDEVLPGARRDAPISRVLRFRYHKDLDRDWGFSVLAPGIRKKLRARHVAEVVESLARFSSILDAGDPLYLAPEGGLETDGRFEEAKAGLIRIIKTARDPVVLPVNLTYDFMTTGRERVFLTIGEEMRGVKDWPRQRLEREIISRISQLGTITFSQLAAVSLQELASLGGAVVHEGEMKQAIVQRAMRLIEAGYRVDGLLSSDEGFERRWQRFISYCGRRNLLRLRGRWLLYDKEKLFGDEPATRVSPWMYAANEFSTITDPAYAPAEVSCSLLNIEGGPGSPGPPRSMGEQRASGLG